MSAFAAYARMVCSQQRAAIDALKAENPGKNGVHIAFLAQYRRENLDEWATFRALWTQNHPMESESPAEIQRLRGLCYDESLELLWKDYQKSLDEYAEEGEEDLTMREKWSAFKIFLEESYPLRGPRWTEAQVMAWRAEQTAHAAACRAAAERYARMPEDPHEIPQSNESGNESDPDWL